jgi:hypothetical protein
MMRGNPSDVSEIERLQAALRKIIDLDHHNHGPESRATKIARTVMPSLPEGRFASKVRIMIIDELNDLKRKNEQLFTDTRARIDELKGENERLRTENTRLRAIIENVALAIGHDTSPLLKSE